MYSEEGVRKAVERRGRLGQWGQIARPAPSLPDFSTVVQEGSLGNTFLRGPQGQLWPEFFLCRGISAQTGEETTGGGTSPEGQQTWLCGSEVVPNSWPAGDGVSTVSEPEAVMRLVSGTIEQDSRNKWNEATLEASDSKKEVAGELQHARGAQLGNRNVVRTVHAR